MGILNFDYLNEVTGNDPAMLKQILMAYTAHLPGDMDELGKLTAAGNYTQAGFLAHKIKSSARILKLESAEWLSEIERAAKLNENVEIIPGKLEKVQKNLEEALVEINIIVNS
ncbi:MAG: Hpt domain-containing protein [Flavobacteriaceae bacterium]|nr:Hpt domain-containing protein [Flavobacteriaceae bacterium]